MTHCRRFFDTASSPRSNDRLLLNSSTIRHEGGSTLNDAMSTTTMHLVLHAPVTCWMHAFSSPKFRLLEWGLARVAMHCTRLPWRPFAPFLTVFNKDLLVLNDLWTFLQLLFPSVLSILPRIASCLFKLLSCCCIFPLSVASLVKWLEKEAGF